VAQIQIDVPDEIVLAESTDAAAFGREMRLLAAIKLYELGRLTSGRAARLADMSRVAFLAELDRHRVFPLEAELKEMEQQIVGSDH
jgi:predicted HTH domain antitoxin